MNKKLSTISSNLGYNNISIFDRNESEIVSKCLEKLFKEISKEQVSHIVHSSPTAILGETGGLIGGVGRAVMERVDIMGVTYLPVLSGYGSLTL